MLQTQYRDEERYSIFSKLFTVMRYSFHQLKVTDWTDLVSQSSREKTADDFKINVFA